MTNVHKIGIGAALIGVAVMNLAGLPSASAALSTSTLPPCTSKVFVDCSPVGMKATVPRGYSIPKKPRGY